MQQLGRRIDELDPAQEIVCICHHGGRSMSVARYLAEHGFSNAYNLTGGLDAWARQVDTAMPTY
jgi:rhodanese-related sulfurtransferase